MIISYKNTNNSKHNKGNERLLELGNTIQSISRLKKQEKKMTHKNTNKSSNTLYYKETQNPTKQ